MSAIAELLDKAVKHCSRPSDRALAERMGVSPQLISNWRKGHAPVADDRIAQIAQIANEPVGEWLVRVHAEQATGEVARAWAALARKLGAAAALAFAALLAPVKDTYASALPGFISGTSDTLCAHVSAG